MANLDTIIGDAVAEQDTPFLVAMTGNRAGVTWSGSSGHSAPGQAASLDTVFRIFSMTKAVGSMAAMMLMDRGALDADMPVASILPEFADMKLLDGFDANRGCAHPRCRPPCGIWPPTPRAWPMNSGTPKWAATWPPRRTPAC